MSRRAYTDLIAQIHESANEEAAALSLPFRTSYTAGRGFHLTMTARPQANQRWTLDVAGAMNNLGDNLPAACLNVGRPALARRDHRVGDEEGQHGLVHDAHADAAEW